MILLSEQPGYDFEMTYFNSDGKESTMCGNGGRCMTAFAHHLGLIRLEAHFGSIDGGHIAGILEISKDIKKVSLKMKDVQVDEVLADHIFMNTGSPHYITFVKDAEGMDILPQARKIRFSERFTEEGTNVDFVEIRKDHLFVRTYERGVEDETYSCGTGVTAAALASAIKCPDNPGYFRILTKGGELNIRFLQDKYSFTEVWMEEQAQFVFQGEVEI